MCTLALEFTTTSRACDKAESSPLSILIYVVLTSVTLKVSSFTRHWHAIHTRYCHTNAQFITTGLLPCRFYRNFLLEKKKNGA